MTTRSSEREEFLADLLITAVEGGTGYWAQVSNYSHSPAATAHVTLHEYHEEDDDGVVPLHEVDLESIEKGLKLYLTFLEGRSDATYREYMAADWANDAGDFDAEDADVIVQFAIFGEIKYG